MAAYSNKKVYLRTFGCQMNNRDSELVESLFLKRGWRIARSFEDADLILFNTCSVREHAEERVWGNIGSLRKLKMRRPGLIIGVMGCMAQRFGSDFFRRTDLVDLVCGPCDEEKLADMAEVCLKTREHILNISNIGKPRKEVFSAAGGNKKKAYVSISHGCSNFCSYCIVPHVRGKEISRKERDIISEIKSLTAQGVEEITLLGQNVNSYEYGFVKLLKKINGMKGVVTIKFMTSHPKDANESLFKAMRDLPKVDKHLHLPLQSGSDRILKLMKRGYTAGRYLSLVKKLKEIVPGCNLTTDIIVGFPGETRADFEKTYNMMKEIKFDAAYIFKYSPREPAASSKMKDSVSEEVKEERNRRLLELQYKIARSKK